VVKNLRLVNTFVTFVNGLMVAIVVGMQNLFAKRRGGKLRSRGLQTPNRPSMPCDVCDSICSQRGSGTCTGDSSNI